MPDYTRRPLFKHGTSGGARPSYWLGSRDGDNTPEDAILTEAGTPILTEVSAQYLLTES